MMMSDDQDNKYRAREELRLAAADLNSELDALNAIYAELEGLLQEYNLGVEGWVVMGPISSNPPVDHLGYGKLGSGATRRWGLLIHSDKQDQTWFIRDAPRPLRIQASDHVVPLMKELQRLAEEMVEQVRASVVRLRGTGTGKSS